MLTGERSGGGIDVDHRHGSHACPPRLAGHHVILVVRRAGPPRGVEVAMPARARRAVLHVQPRSPSGPPIVAWLAWRSSRLRDALGELVCEGTDLPLLA